MTPQPQGWEERVSKVNKRLKELLDGEILSANTLASIHIIVDEEIQSFLAQKDAEKAEMMREVVEALEKEIKEQGRYFAKRYFLHGEFEVEECSLCLEDDDCCCQHKIRIEALKTYLTALTAIAEKHNVQL